MTTKDKIYLNLLIAILKGILLILNGSEDRVLVYSFRKYAQSTIKLAEGILENEH